jgi:hypothetical protein
VQSAENAKLLAGGEKEKAGDGIRTHDNHVGNVVLYQLSYTRILNLSSAWFSDETPIIRSADTLARLSRRKLLAPQAFSCHRDSPCDRYNRYQGAG